MEVERLADGLWRWTARHPAWREGDDWPAEVGCVYLETPEAIVLVDPLVPAGPDERERFLRALDRDVARLGLPVAIVLTCEWHGRSTAELRERYASLAGTPAGLVAHAAPSVEEVVYWIPAHAALVAGDVLLGGGDEPLRLMPESWTQGRSSHARIREELAPLLGLPVELVLPSHGAPVREDARGALAAALG